MRVAPSFKTTATLKSASFIRPPRQEIIRLFGNDSRERVSHVARRKTLKERIMAPGGEAAFSIGKGAIAGGAVVGLSALCFYGLGLSNQSGAIDHAM